jgi:hypothetical protein
MKLPMKYCGLAQLSVEILIVSCHTLFHFEKKLVACSSLYFCSSHLQHYIFISTVLFDATFLGRIDCLIIEFCLATSEVKRYESKMMILDR